MNKIKILTLLILSLATNCFAGDRTIPEYLQDVCVGIDNGANGRGSGFLYTRKNAEGKSVTFVWTASHVVSEREMVMDFFLEETNYLVLQFTNITISQLIVSNGRTIGTNTAKARIIKESQAHDLAILLVITPIFNTNSVEFDLSGRLPRVGEEVYNTSCPYGVRQTFSKGVFSFVGRKAEDEEDVESNLFDQATLTIFKGSSGSGAYLPNGKCVGVVTAMTGPQMAYMVPVRRIMDWANKEHVQWAINPDFPMPSVKEVKRLPVEDAEYYDN